MNPSVIIWPVLAQVLLTLLMYIVLGKRKAVAVKAGEFDRQKAALDNKAWPDAVLKVSNNIDNQFEVPVLFYVLCLVLYSIDGVSVAALALAWLFALSRYAHAYVHIGSNYVRMRLRLFLIGCFDLIALLLLAAWELATLL